MSNWMSHCRPLSPSASRLPSGVLTNKPLLSHLMFAFIWGYLFLHGVMDEAHGSHLPMWGYSFSTVFQSPSGYVGDRVANAFKYQVLTCKRNLDHVLFFHLATWEMVVLWAEGWVMALGHKLGLSTGYSTSVLWWLVSGSTHMYGRIEQVELISEEEKTNDIWVCFSVAAIKLWPKTRRMKDLFGLYFYIMGRDQGKSGQDFRQEQRHEPWKNTFYRLSLLTFSTTYFIQFKATSPMFACSQLVGTSTSVINKKKMLPVLW